MAANTQVTENLGLGTQTPTQVLKEKQTQKIRISLHKEAHSPGRGTMRMAVMRVY